MDTIEVQASRLRLLLWSLAALIVLFVGMCVPAMAQAPTITSISPNTVSAGGPNFTLTVTGSGFITNSVVQINGSTRPTVYVSSLQLTATIFASDIVAPGQLNVTVLNTASGVSLSSNAVTLTVVIAASPVLASVSPGFSTQGVSQVSMTLVGANFRPGATVVISPPLATVSASNGHTRATDVSVLSATVVNSGVMTALVSVSPNAATGLRAVDVLNLDGTSTAGTAALGTQGSSQPLTVSRSNSIGAPLSVLNMAMMHPRDGTVVMQGDELDAEAVLAGTGTGTVIGQWVWDGNVVEQFSATIVGGQSTTIQTRQSLPTWSLGAHTLQLQMLQPNQVSSRAIEVVVNPGKWKLEQLLQPAYGAVFAANAPPHLLWATVPGAMKYQVGFSSKPYFSTVDKWFDVTENHWQVPDEIWKGLPEGELYWTVRTVDASGEPRKPLPMRVIYRAPQDNQKKSGVAHLSVRYRMVEAKFEVRGADRVLYPDARLSLQQETAASAPTSAPAAAAPESGTDAEAPPAAPAAAQPQAAIRAGPAEDGQIGINTQWASGSNPPDSNALSVAEHLLYQQGPWKIEVNGSGLLNSILNSSVQRTSQGKVNNYVLQVGYQRKDWQQKDWGVGLRFGIVTPVLYCDAQFVNEATPRQGVELTLKTPVGAFSGFINTDDTAAGGGSSIAVHQRIAGASWQAPLPPWAQFRLMWLNVADIGVISGPSASGDVYGAMLNIHLTQKWLWSSEYAVSHDNPNTASAASTREFGRAWRTGVSGQPGKTNVNISYRDVSANFGNPSNPGLTPNSQPNVRGVNSAITQTTIAGTFGLNYTFLANNVHPTVSDELLLNTFDETWSKPVDVKTSLALDVRQSLTQTGTVPLALQAMPAAVTGAQDVRDLSGNINLRRQAGTVTISAGGQRDWNHNTLFPASSTITSSLNVGSNLVTRGFFQLNSQASVNWVAANGLAVGTSRSVSINVQPALVWKRPSMQLSPLITVTQGQTVLSNGTRTSNTFMGQYGGRIAWTLPGVMKCSALSAQGSYNQNRNTVISLNQPSTQLLVLWTATWGHKHTM